MPDPNNGAPAAAPAEGGAPAAGAPPAAGGTSVLEMIPAEFKDKPWAKENATTPENFFKFVDNQNALIGKKGLILPGEGATDKDWEPIYDALGRPKNPDEYNIESIPELKDAKRDPESDKALKTLFHSTGLPKSMAAKLTQGFEKMIYERTKADIEKNKAEDKAFDEYNTKLFGDKKETIVANAQKVLRESVPPEALPAFDKLDGATMSLLVAITNNVYAKFGQEDAFKGGAGAGAGGTRETFEELSNQQRELMKNPAFKDSWHPENKALMAKNAEIMAKMRALKP